MTDVRLHPPIVLSTPPPVIAEAAAAAAPNDSRATHLLAGSNAPIRPCRHTTDDTGDLHQASSTTSAASVHSIVHRRSASAALCLSSETRPSAAGSSEPWSVALTRTPLPAPIRSPRLVSIRSAEADLKTRLPGCTHLPRSDNAVVRNPRSPIRAHPGQSICSSENPSAGSVCSVRLLSPSRSATVTSASELKTMLKPIRLPSTPFRLRSPRLAIFASPMSG
ncbi:hypothetical protein ACLOJK_018128 [Asimina triloba]